MSKQPDRQGRILCLDGGGVRGISSLWILKEIMDEVAQMVQDPFADPGERPPIRPCDYFDVICGTSTGGLIALMLGRMGYTVDQAIKAYTDLSEAVFTAKLSNPTARYDHAILEQCIKDVIGKSPYSLEADNMLAFEDGCKTFVVASTLLESADKPFLMRTYTRAQTQEPSPFRAKIWEAARATSAAPTFFNPVIIDGCSYSDGGTTANNPTLYGVFEGWSLWGATGIKCLVSLGTGLEAPLALPGSALRMFGPRWTSFLRKILPRSLFHKLEISLFSVRCLTSSARTHNEVLSGTSAYGAGHIYHRLNVSDERMAKISLDAWSKTEEMVEYAKAYMALPENIKAKKEIAKQLIHADQGQWRPPGVERFRQPQGSNPQGGFFGRDRIHLSMLVHLTGHDIGGISMKCIINPASGFSVISNTLIQTWSLTTKPLPANMREESTSEDGTKHRHLDFVTLMFSFEGHSELYKHPFSVLDMDQDVIIGQDFLIAHPELFQTERQSAAKPLKSGGGMRNLKRQFERIGRHTSAHL